MRLGFAILCFVASNVCFGIVVCTGLVIQYKTCVKRPLSKRPHIGFQDQLLLNAGQKYCKMLQWQHSAILSTLIKLPFVFMIFVLSILSGRFTRVLLHSVLLLIVFVCVLSWFSAWSF